MLTNVANPLHVPQLREIEDAAAKGAIAVTRLEVGKPDELDTSFRALLQNRVDALLVPPDTLFNTLRRRVVGLAAAFRVPAMYGFRENVEDGGLMSYGVNIGESYRRAATYVDRILRGPPPGGLARGATHQDRAGDQPEDRPRVRPHCAADVARPRRRGDRVTSVVAVHESSLLALVRGPLSGANRKTFAHFETYRF